MHINNYKSFLEFLEIYANVNGTCIFRGVPSDRHKLIPSIGRLFQIDRVTKLTEKDEDLIFRHFKQRANPFLLREYDDMNLLAIAQHHGLPTRLLDWSYNPLAAVYFAVEKEIFQPLEKENEIDHSVIYVYNKPIRAHINKEFKSIKVDRLEFFVPNYSDDRIINQNGLFTIHPFPWNELNDDKIEIVTIDLSYRRELRRILNKLGVNQSTIYPGLDGVAGHIKWMKSDYY